MRDPGMLVLVSLAGGPRHGYAIRQDVEEFAGVRLGAGTLYGAVSRLEHGGLIEAQPAEARRRPYRLTAAGRDELTERLDQLERIVARAREVRWA